MRPACETPSRDNGRGACLPLFTCLFLLILSWAGAAAAARPEVLRVRYWSAPDHTRVVLDLSAPATYEIRRVKNPERIAVNVKAARFAATSTLPVGDGLVRRIRRNALSSKAQVVLDLEKDAAYRVFALPAADGRPFRIVVDVSRPTPRPAAVEAGAKSQPAAAAPEPGPESAKPFTVVLDPGHGGLDPGAIRGGIREKDVVLGVARQAARLINRIPGFKAVLTRDRDYFLSLARRVEIAQKLQGDVFLSIHANTHRQRSVAGMQVYFLSLKGATDREARELADKENAADLGGLPPDETHDDSVLSILMDLRMTRVLNNSSRLAEQILAAADRSGVVKGRNVKQAGFQVLRSLAMPSALVELAYLSNREDRELLSSERGRLELASALVDGVLAFSGNQEALASYAGGRAWNRTYQVRRGDSLWKLARRCRTTIEEIRERNELSSTRLLIGQKLRLPALD